MVRDRVQQPRLFGREWQVPVTKQATKDATKPKPNQTKTKPNQNKYIKNNQTKTKTLVERFAERLAVYFKSFLFSRGVYRTASYIPLMRTASHIRANARRAPVLPRL